jgi:hypothetical protein
MLTRLKLTRGEGQLVEPSSYPTRRKQFHSPQVAERHSPSMAHVESHERVPDEEEDLRQTIIELKNMMKILLEWTIMSQGEGSNPSMHQGGSGDKTPGRDGGNGASPPPSPPPSSSSSSSSTSSKHLPNGHGKTPSQIPSLKLDIKFELPLYNGEVNAEKLDNWVRQIEVYSRIQKIQDDETKIQLASLRLDGSSLIWWESKTQEEMKRMEKFCFLGMIS